MIYGEYVRELREVLEKLEVTYKGKNIIQQKAFDILLKKSEEIKKKERLVCLIGNGASASMASHMALDMWKHNGIKTMVFNDLVSLTAISNDYSYEEVFARPLDFFARKGDMVVCISSSGNSANILRAAELAKRKGVFAVTFSAMKEINPLRKLGNLNFYIPAQSYGLAEIGHQALLHLWVDYLLHKESTHA